MPPASGAARVVGVVDRGRARVGELGIRSSRCETASKTLTVPATLTRIPSGGLARTNGTWSAARWTTRRDLVLVDRALESVQVGDVALDDRHAPASSPSTSRAGAGPRRGRSRRPRRRRRAPPGLVQAPRQPRMPVTRMRRGLGKRGVLIHRDGLGEELERGAALLVGPKPEPLSPPKGTWTSAPAVCEFTWRIPACELLR